MRPPPRSTEETIFADALALPTTERRAFVEHASHGDPELAARVLGLLHGYEQKSGFLENPPVHASRPPGQKPEHPGVSGAGEQIGPYKLVERIGEGSCGVVYLAEQERPVRRRVALKIIKLGLDTREFVARFEAERQALALMDHPGVAKVFDAGATESGRPFFVMEWVRGLSITRYCDEHRLSPADRLRLFIHVCHAIQHAHQKGIIHRDIKPSNILVTTSDGAPAPKVIDFGIAKVTQGHLTTETLFTRFHAFVGTPAYSSPEQAEITGLDVDTRSDVYSLGVLLYELLCGRPPFDPEALARAGLDGMLRTIREVEPPRPFERFGALPLSDRTLIAHQRGNHPAALASWLRGDLEWIVLRCLEKDRARRYQSPAEMARDIEHHLASEPISARPPSVSYRLGKMVRRHRVAFSAAMAVTLSLVAGLVTASVLLVRATRAEHAEAQLRREAEREREAETKRVSQTDLTLASHLFEEGKAGDAFAYLVHAVRKDPGNVTIAPRLVSALTSRTFLLPQGAPFQTGSPVLAMRFTLDGRMLLVGTEDGACRTFDADTGGLLGAFQLGKPVRRGGWVFAPGNDAVFAICFADGSIAVFDRESGRPLWGPIDAESGRAGEQGSAIELRLSSDGRWLLEQRPHGFRLIDAADGRTALRLPASGPFMGIDVSPDSRELVAIDNSVLQAWSLPDVVPRLPPVDVSPPGLHLLPRYSPDGSRIGVFDPYGGVHLLDAQTGRPLRAPVVRDHVAGSLADFLPDGRAFVSGWHQTELLDLESGVITTLAVGGDGDKSVSADGGRVLTVSDDGVARLWDTRTGRLVAEPALRQDGKFRAALSPDGRSVGMGNSSGGIHLFRVTSGAARPLVPPRQLKAWTHQPFLPDPPARLLSYGTDRFDVIDIASGRTVTGGFLYPNSGSRVLRAAPDSLKFYFRPDFRFVAARDMSAQLPTEVWELSPVGEARMRLLSGSETGPPGTIAVAFSPAGDRVAHVTDGARVIRVWDLHTGEPVGPGCATGGGIIAAYSGVHFSGDGSTIAGGLVNGGVAIWEVATGRRVRTLETSPGSAAKQVHFSPDGSRLITVNLLGEVSLWDAATGTLAAPVWRGIDAHTPEFSPDGAHLALMGNHTVSLWRARDGAAIRQMSIRGVRVVRFSPDGERIVTTNATGLAQVWDVHSGQPLTDPIRHSPVSLWLEGFSPDGRFIETIIEGGEHNVRAVPPPMPPGEPTPEWLLQLASICATKRVDEAGGCVDAPELVAQIEQVRHQLAALPEDAPLADWGRWFLDDSPARSIAPGFTITPAEAEVLDRSRRE